MERLWPSIRSVYLEHLLRWCLVDCVGGCKEESFVMWQTALWQEHSTPSMHQDQKLLFQATLSQPRRCASWGNSLHVKHFYLGQKFMEVSRKILNP